MNLTKEEKEIILESLKFTKAKYENYKDYPSKEFQKSKVVQVDALIKKIKEN